jgi:hypothetical protein
MSKANKSKSSLANVIKERAQRPDFLPKSFIEDNNRLAEEKHSRTHELTPSQNHAPALPASTPSRNEGSQSGTSGSTSVSSARAPTHPRSYAQAVLSAQAEEIQEYLPQSQPPATSSNRGPSLSPYRRELKRAATYLTDPAKDQLRVLCFNERTSEEDLLREAIDMLFTQRGLPPIAFQGAPSRKPRPN